MSSKSLFECAIQILAYHAKPNVYLIMIYMYLLKCLNMYRLQQKFLFIFFFNKIPSLSILTTLSVCALLVTK